MAKSIKSLAGASKDAYLERIGASDSDVEAGKRVAARLKGEVTRVWVKLEALDEVTSAAPEGAADTEVSEAGAAATEPDDFNPYEPNVIVVLRTVGRDKLLSALREIATTDQLRRLAREQQLGVDADIAGAEPLRLAIIQAAERRVANRRAAAS